MSVRLRPCRAPSAARQRGQAMLLTVLLLAVGISAVIYNFVAPAKESIERDRITAAALAQAKAALIGYAIGVDLSVSGPRPGDLPCPDRDNDGSSAPPDSPCTGAVLGRLPWKTLGLPDLRDGYGERLWYAVSSNFKNSPRTACSTAGAAGCLNSDTRGTITIRNRDGTVRSDGSNPDPYTPSGVIAVIIAPGAILRRQDGTLQDRSAAGQNNPINYLDVLSGTEDNAAFADGSNVDGFIAGDIRDASNNLIVNDRLLTVTYQDLMPLMERRVAKEALNCLASYANANGGRYPWAVPITNLAEPYGDVIGTRFGRIPDGPFGQTLLGAIPAIFFPALKLQCDATPAKCMATDWPNPGSPRCNFANGSWWRNWKEQVFFGVDAKYTPFLDIQANIINGIMPLLPCPACLTVNPPSPAADKRVVVMVAGKRLAPVAGGQPRSAPSDKQTTANYVEGENDWMSGPNADTFVQQKPTATFNDYLLYQ